MADLLSAHRGIPTYQSNVCGWKTGSRRPSDATILAIEAVTMGQVPRSSWACWRERERRRQRNRAKAA